MARDPPPVSPTQTLWPISPYTPPTQVTLNAHKKNQHNNDRGNQTTATSSNKNIKKSVPKTNNNEQQARTAALLQVPPTITYIKGNSNTTYQGTIQLTTHTTTPTKPKPNPLPPPTTNHTPTPKQRNVSKQAELNKVQKERKQQQTQKHIQLAEKRKQQIQEGIIPASKHTHKRKKYPTPQNQPLSETPTIPLPTTEKLTWVKEPYQTIDLEGITQSNKTLTICTYNTNGQLNSFTLTTIIDMMQKLDIDVITLQDTRATRKHAKELTRQAQNILGKGAFVLSQPLPLTPGSKGHTSDRVGGQMIIATPKWGGALKRHRDDQSQLGVLTTIKIQTGNQPSAPCIYLISLYWPYPTKPTTSTRKTKTKNLKSQPTSPEPTPTDKDDARAAHKSAGLHSALSRFIKTRTKNRHRSSTYKNKFYAKQPIYSTRIPKIQ